MGLLGLVSIFIPGVLRSQQKHAKCYSQDLSIASYIVLLKYIEMNQFSNLVSKFAPHLIFQGALGRHSKMIWYLDTTTFNSDVFRQHLFSQTEKHFLD